MPEPFPEGPVNFQEVFGVTQTSENTFRGNLPLKKPVAGVRGAYGGNIMCQALIVAMKSCPESMTPHSFHSYYVKAVSEDISMDWEVIHISDGRNFNNRLVKGFQEGKLMYMGMVSLTKKNSIARDQAKFDAWANERRKQGKPVQIPVDDDDADDMPMRPFSLETPLPKGVPISPPADLPLNLWGANYLTYHKFPREITDLSLTKEEENIDPARRELVWYEKLGCDEEGVNQPVVGLTKHDQFAALACISDLWMNSLLVRTLRMPGRSAVELNYPTISLDHVIYFHNDDFDVTKWMPFCQRTLRYANLRLLSEVAVYNDEGTHVATILQESLSDISFIAREIKM